MDAKIDIENAVTSLLSRGHEQRLNALSSPLVRLQTLECIYHLYTTAKASISGLQE